MILYLFFKNIIWIFIYTYPSSNNILMTYSFIHITIMYYYPFCWFVMLLMMTFLSFCVFIHPGVVDYETTKDILYYLDNTHGIEGIASTSKTE